MSKLVKNYIYNLGYQIFVIIVPLLTMPYLARVLHPENMGIYSYVTSCASIINSIGILGLYNYGNREIAYIRDDKKRLNETFNEILSIRMILCVFATIAYVIWALLSDYTSSFLLYYPWLLAGFIDISWFFAGIEDMGAIALKNFAIKFLSVIGIFVFVRHEDDVWKYLTLIAVITFLSNLSMYLPLRRLISKFQFTLQHWKNHVKASLILFLPQIAGVFYLQVDKVMLQYLSADTSQVGFYDQAEKIVNIPFTVVAALSVVMMPRIANEFKKGHDVAIKNYITQAAKFAMMLAIPMFFGMYAIAGNFIPWYLGEEFLPVISAVRIVSPIIIINSWMNVAGAQYLTAVDEIKTLTISNVAAAVMNIVVNAILIPTYGFYGAAIATVLSSLSCTAIQLHKMNKKIKVFHLICGMWKYCLGGGFMFVFVSLLEKQLPSNALSTALLLIVGVILYMLGLCALKEELLFVFVKKAKERLWKKLKDK